MGRRTKTVAAEGIERFALAELMLRCRSGNRQYPEYRPNETTRRTVELLLLKLRLAMAQNGTQGLVVGCGKPQIAAQRDDLSVDYVYLGLSAGEVVKPH